MIRFAICEDTVELAYEQEKLIAETCAEHNMPCTIMLYFSGKKLMEDIQAGKSYDIYFLDIRLDGIDGIKLGKEIRASIFGDNAILFYVSSFPHEYLFDMFNLHIFNFINKPIEPEEFKRKLLESLAPRNQLCLRDLKGRYHRLDYSNIVSIESRNKYIIISIMQNKNVEEIIFRKKLSDIIEVLPMNRFIPPRDYFIHPIQSFIINLHYVTSFERKFMILLNDSKRTVGISRPKVPAITSQVDNYTKAMCNRIN